MELCHRNAIAPAAVSILVGLLVLKWEWLASSIGVETHVNRTNSALSFEYALGLVATFVLGFVFPHRPATCAISFMAGPTLLTHSIYILKHGFPNLWPVELLLLAALTVPYVGLAYSAAYLRKRWKRATPTPD
jgi:hypothetical protein